MDKRTALQGWQAALLTALVLAAFEKWWAVATAVLWAFMWFYDKRRSHSANGESNV